MITNVPQEEVIRYGARFRGTYLLEQTGYTLGMARLSEQAFTPDLGADFLAEMERTKDAVSVGLRSKEIAEEESRLATVAQNESVRVGKIWRRRVAAFGRFLALRGIETPTELREVGASTNSVPELRKQMEVKLGKLAALTLTGQPATRRDTLARDGGRFLEQLAGADTTQELKIQKLPPATRDFYRNKGTLFLGLKQINSIARMLFADDPVKAAQFNLSILYRNVSGKKQAGEAAAGEAGK